jgi:hypothetical protein
MFLGSGHGSIAKRAKYDNRHLTHGIMGADKAIWSYKV